MQTMKKFGLALSFGLAFLLTADAQTLSYKANISGTNVGATYGPTVPAQGVTNLLVASASGGPVMLGIPLQKGISLSYSFASSATASDNMALVYAGSVDGTTNTIPTTPSSYHQLICAHGTGGNFRCATTNVSEATIGNFPFVCLLYWTNAAATATATNMTLTVGAANGKH